MTDLEAFIELYKRFGIEIKTFEEDGYTCVTLNGYDEDETNSDKFDGYPGFYSGVKFTKEGEFIQQGFWES